VVIEISLLWRRSAFLRYLAIGTFCAVLYGLICWLLLAWFHLHVSLSNFIAYAACMIINYLLQYHVSFQAQTNHLRTFVRFMTWNVFVALLLAVVNGVALGSSGMRPAGTAVISTLLAGVILVGLNFLVYSRLVFAPHSGIADGPQETGPVLKPNAQYNVTDPQSLQQKVASRQRRRMFEAFLAEMQLTPDDRILDVGATSDRSYDSSNYLEEWYSWKNQIVACGLDDASFLEELHPGLTYVRADGLALPFADRSFDVVHCSAVIEHVGSWQNQCRLVAELCRVARRGVFITTPNRWFPIEVHTSLPLVHWLPKPVFRSLLLRTRFAFFAAEQNLNLLDHDEMERASRLANWKMRVMPMKLGIFTSNLMLIGVREDAVTDAQS